MKEITLHEYTLEGTFSCDATNVEAQERIIKTLKEMDAFDDMIIRQKDNRAYIYFAITFDDEKTRDEYYDWDYNEDDTILYFADEEFDIENVSFYGCEKHDYAIEREINDEQWSLIKDWFK